MNDMGFGQCSGNDKGYFFGSNQKRIDLTSAEWWLNKDLGNFFT